MTVRVADAKDLRRCYCGHLLEEHRRDGRCANALRCLCQGFRHAVAVTALAGVSLSPDGDLCSRCARTINVNEPIHGRVGGPIWCNGCNDAERERPERCTATGVPLADLATSEVMRRCAALLIASSLPGALAEVARAHANELHGRAFLLESFARERTSPPYSADGWADVLAAIGEVRS